MKRGRLNCAAGAEALERHRLALDRAGGLVRRQQHVERPAFDQTHQRRAARQRDGKRGDERAERDRLGRQRARNSVHDVSQAALQQIPEIGADQHRDQDGRAQDRHGQQHLKGRLRQELDRNRLPVGHREERAAFEEELQVHVRDFVCVVPVCF